MKTSLLEFKINNQFENLSVRDFLAFFKVSKKMIHKQEMFNLIRVNEKIVRLNYRLQKDDLLSFKLAPLDEVIDPYKGKIDIVYEDEDILVVNKPPKLLIHEDGNTKNTLTNKVAYHFQQQGYYYPVLPVHRIDFDSSGIVLFAKHFISLSYLANQFSNKTVKKTYIAICDNYFKEHEGVIFYNIGKDRHSNKYIVTDSGKEALTNYFVMEQKNNKSKVELTTKGDRPHQIRVHLAYIGHPIVGDKKYGKTKYNRLLLHFAKLEVVHPRSQKIMPFYIKEHFKLY